MGAVVTVDANDQPITGDSAASAEPVSAEPEPAATPDEGAIPIVDAVPIEQVCTFRCLTWCAARRNDGVLRRRFPLMQATTRRPQRLSRCRRSLRRKSRAKKRPRSRRERSLLRGRLRREEKAVGGGGC